MRTKLLHLLLALSSTCLHSPLVNGQWTNRYPKVAGFPHHVYLEGYNLPTLNAGPTEPSIAPDGHTVAFAARGWLWLLDLRSGVAERVTKGKEIDSTPVWSPNGDSIAFVRDSSSDTRIVLLNVSQREERVLIDTPALDLDPAFSHDGKSIFYSSAVEGDLDLWQIIIKTGEKKRLTNDRGLELKPQPLPDGNQLVYLSKQGNLDAITILDLRDGSRRFVTQQAIASQLRPAVSHDGRLIAATVPAGETWQLWLFDTKGGPAVQLAQTHNMPLMPAFDPATQNVYFVEADRFAQFHLWRSPVVGGVPADVTPRTWQWGVPTTRVVVVTRRQGGTNEIPARLSASDSTGHPAIATIGQARFDNQNGTVYVYSPGRLEFEVPVGTISVTAGTGFSGIAETVTRTVSDKRNKLVRINIQSVWNPSAHGWVSGDLHFHLNYGGPYTFSPNDLLIPLAAEEVDVATPLVANIHTRLSDLQWWRWRRDGKRPIIVFGQEVRSHFLSHIGLIGTRSLFWPWFFGPGYPVYDGADLNNGDVLAHARHERGISSYVHPAWELDTFPSTDPPRGFALELVPDGPTRI